MKDILSPSLFASLTSLVISVITLYRFFKNQRFQQQQFNKTLDRSLTNKLLDLRLEHYPKAFEITDSVFKEKGGNFDPAKIKNTVEELIEWKKGVINLVISSEALTSFYVLRDAAMKSPANNGTYSSEQVEKISVETKDFRKQLRKDLGILFREEKLRRST